jgi:imidazolonepropionase-like amidohydrolase/Tol biopolymer transport system component
MRVKFTGNAAIWAIVVALMPAAATPASATDSWDVSAPPVATREIPIDVREGTWMNVDVSPDGKTIAFDMLGDIYTMPVTGGEARRIAEGLAYEMHPRFSPDGRQIAFISDRGGGDNIWLMNVDGSGKRQLTRETFTLLNSPAWSPDGRFIAARKHFTTERSGGTGEIWLYSIQGGTGIALVERPNPQRRKELGEPIFTPDGAGIYYTRNITAGDDFEYAQNTNQDIFDIERYDLRSGKVTTSVSGAGGSVRATPSPDGRTIAFVRRERDRSKLYIKDIQSGAEAKVYDALDQDQQETWAIYGLYPSLGWTPDSRSLIFWSGGKINRLDVATGVTADIPFHVKDTRVVIDPVRPVRPVAEDGFSTRLPRFAALSPDRRTVVYETLGRLYAKPVGQGAARPLTKADGDFQLYPSWSHDGRKIVFVSWNDARLGEVRIANADGSGVHTISREPGLFRRPRFSPDGRTIVVERGKGGLLTSARWSENPGIYLLPVGGGDARLLSREGVNPQYGRDSDRVYFELGGEKRKLVSVDLDGGNQRVHATGAMVTTFQISPQGDALAFRENYNAFVMPFFEGAKAIDISPRATQLPVVRLSRDGGRFPTWSGNTLSWTTGPTLFSTDAIAALRGVNAAAPRETLSLGIEAKADKPTGTVALVGARVVTMSDAQGGIIDDGVVVIRSNRIVAIGPRGSVAIPADARTVDVRGKTIIPGLIDAHAHGPQADNDLIPQQNWNAMAHLAFGVTTVHDPFNDSSEVFPASELQRAGLILAPRIFSSGDAVYGSRRPGVFAEIDSLADAESHVRRLKAEGAWSIKNYNQPRREQRQQVVVAAQHQGLLTVAEGASLYERDITLISDGNSSLEHNLPPQRLYGDILSFFGQTRVAHTPTLGVSFGGPAGEPYWISHDQVWKNPILTRHAPPTVLNAELVRVMQAPDEDFVDSVNAASAKLLSEHGVPISAGGHGQQQGLSLHWELWSFVRGGFTPLDALKTATVTAARELGMADLGTLEVGKLADLVVLNTDPLKEIRNTADIDRIMLNGRLYEALTLNESTTGIRQRKPYFWENDARRP